MATICSTLLITDRKKRDFQERQKHERQLRIREIREKNTSRIFTPGVKGFTER